MCGATTPKEAQIALNNEFKDHYPIQKVMDFLYNYRRRLTNGLDEVQLLQNFVALHPHLVKYYEESKEGDVFHFTLTLTTEYLWNKLKMYGKEVIGFDGVYKWTTSRIPTFVVTATNEYKEGFVGAYILSTRGDAAHLKRALEPILGVEGKF